MIQNKLNVLLLVSLWLTIELIISAPAILVLFLGVILIAVFQNYGNVKTIAHNYNLALAQNPLSVHALVHTAGMFSAVYLSIT